jgi:hypothetical protein
MTSHDELNESTPSRTKAAVTNRIAVLSKVLATFLVSLVLFYELVFRTLRTLAIRRSPELETALEGWSIGNPDGPDASTLYSQISVIAAVTALVAAVSVASLVFWLSTRVFGGKRRKKKE